MCGGSSQEDSHCNLGTHHPGTTATIRGHEGDTQPMPQPRTLLQNGRHGRNIRPWRHYIIAAEAVIDRSVVEDRVQDTDWNTRPGFPGLTLKNVAFESPQPTRQVTLVTGAQLITESLPRPYEIEASGFLTALETHDFVLQKRIRFDCSKV